MKIGIQGTLLAVLLVGGHMIGRALPRAAEPAVNGSKAATARAADVAKIAGSKIHQSAIETLKRAPAATLEELPALMLAAFEEEDADLRRLLINRLATRWGESDPAAAFAWMEATIDRESQDRYMAYISLFETWARIDPRTAIQQEASYALETVFKVTAQRDPQMFLQLVEEFGTSWGSAGAVFQIAFEQLAEEDPASLSKWIEDSKQPKPVAQAAARALAAAAITSGGGSGTNETLSKIADKELRKVALEHAMERLIETDLVAAEQFLNDTVASGSATPGLRHNFLYAKALEDPFEAARLLATWQEAEAGPYSNYITSVYRALPTDAETLHRFVTEIGGTHSGFSINNLIVYSGGLPMYAKLAEQLYAMPQDETRDKMLVTLTSRWIGEDVAAASAFAENLRDWPEWQAAQKWSFSARQFISVDEVFDFATEIGWQGAMPKDVFELVSKEAPQRAIDHLASLDVKAQLKSAPVLAESLAQRDPESGIAWIGGLPEGPVQVEAARTFAKASTYDTYALSEWATTLESGETLDAVAGVLSNSVAKREPESAFAWALAIGEAKNRSAALEKAVDGWKGDNLEAVLEALRSSDELSDTERQGLLKRLEEKP